MIYVGTAGYSYKDWVGPFYPEGIKDASMFDYYARHFNFVEVNSSYYHMPGTRLFESINRKSGDDFRVAVKLFQGFTHDRNIGMIEADKFKYALGPVMESGKLICLLAQFPYSFHFNQENLDHLKKIRQWFDGIEVNVEFRNQNWIRSEVIEQLRNENLGFVCVDEPRIRGLIKNVIAATSKVGYLRLHGRNAEKWYGGEGSDRYNYLYSHEELKDWIPGIRDMVSNANVTVVSFNNHPLGKAVENARTLLKLYQGRL